MPASTPPIDHVVQARPGATVVVGVFDGVHLGHVALLEQAAKRAEVDRSDVVALVIDGVDDAHRLTSVRRRCQLLVRAGASRAIVVRVAEATELAERVCDVLRSVRPSRVLIDQESLAPHELAAIMACPEQSGLVPIDVFVAHNHPEHGAVTAAAIAERVAAGDIEVAVTLIGRPFELEVLIAPWPEHDPATTGTRWLLTSTDPGIVTLDPGTYAAEVRADGRWLPAVLAVDADRGPHELWLLGADAVLADDDARLALVDVLRRT